MKSTLNPRQKRQTRLLPSGRLKNNHISSGRCIDLEKKRNPTHSSCKLIRYLMFFTKTRSWLHLKKKKCSSPRFHKLSRINPPRFFFFIITRITQKGKRLCPGDVFIPSKIKAEKFRRGESNATSKRTWWVCLWKNKKRAWVNKMKEDHAIKIKIKYTHPRGRFHSAITYSLKSRGLWKLHTWLINRSRFLLNGFEKKC